MRRTIAATEAVLLFPAMLFMTALFMRNVQPQPLEPARTFQQIVLWYSARPHVGLWVFLMAMPFVVLMLGCTTLVAHREAALRAIAALRDNAAMLFIGAMTAASGAILGIVALHALTD